MFLFPCAWWVFVARLRVAAKAWHIPSFYLSIKWHEPSRTWQIIGQRPEDAWTIQDCKICADSGFMSLGRPDFLGELLHVGDWMSIYLQDVITHLHSWAGAGYRNKSPILLSINQKTKSKNDSRLCIDRRVLQESTGPCLPTILRGQWVANRRDPAVLDR